MSLKTGDENAEPVSESDLDDVRNSMGIGTFLVIDMNRSGSVLSYRVGEDLGEAFDEECQENLVCAVSGLLCPILPEQEVDSGASWKVTPGTKQKPMLTSELEVAPEPLVGRLAVLQRMVQSQLARERDSSSPLGGKGDFLNPFAAGIVMEYTYRGFSDSLETGANRWISYGGEVRDKHIEMEDSPEGMDVKLLKVGGDLYLDRGVGWPVASNAAVDLDISAERPADNMTMTAKLSASQ